MSMQDVANRVAALCREGKNLEAIQEFYSPNIVSVEAFEAPGFARIMEGMEAIIGKNTWWYENHDVHSMEVFGPYFNGDDRFALYFKGSMTQKATGQKSDLVEVGLYTVEGGKIVREEFFYAGM